MESVPSPTLFFFCCSVVMSGPGLRLSRNVISFFLLHPALLFSLLPSSRATAAAKQAVPGWKDGCLLGFAAASSIQPLPSSNNSFSSFAVSRELNTTANGEGGGEGGWKIRIAEWKTGRGNPAMGPQSSAFSLHPRMSSGHELDIETMSSLKERNDMIYMNKYQLLRGLHFLQIWQMFLRSDSSRCRDALRGNTPSLRTGSVRSQEKGCTERTRRRRHHPTPFSIPPHQSRN